MADDRQLINVRTWKRFNQLLTSCLPIETTENLLQQICATWLDIARAETVIVSILLHNEKSLLVATADRVGTSVRRVEASSDLWDEDAVLEIAGDQPGFSAPLTYAPIPLGTDQFDGGVLLEARDSRPLDTSASNELTQLTQVLIVQALVIAQLDEVNRSPTAVAITDPTADDELVPLANPLDPPTAHAPTDEFGITEAEFQQRLQRAKLEAMAEFAAGAGHEINNPIASIAGRVELLLRSETNPDRRQSLAAIGGQAYRVRDMIGDAMLFGRPPNPEPTICSLNEAVEEVITKLKTTDRGQICHFRLQMAPGVVVLADPSQLRVVISALINNSLESIRENGEVRVNTQIVADEPDKRFARLEITDNGIGMEARDREFLFDPFFSGRQAGRGLGFGLPKCWRIIDQHHGRIDFDSRPEGPTTFTVLWPVAEMRPDRRDHSDPAVTDSVADQLIDDRLEDTGYRIPRRRRKRSF